MKNKKKILVTVALLLIIALGGIALRYDKVKPSMDKTSLVISTSIDEKGNPKDIIAKASKVTDIMEISKDNKEIYISVKVTRNKLKESKVTLLEGEAADKKVNEKIIKVSKAGYINYQIKDLKNLNSTVYQINFLNNDKIADVQGQFNLK